jgi:hypothetical protein
MLGCLVTVTGWRLGEIRATPWPDVWGLWEYWSRNPPPHVLMAAGIGAGFPLRRRNSPDNRAERDAVRGAVAAKPFSALPPHVRAAMKKG